MPETRILDLTIGLSVRYCYVTQAMMPSVIIQTFSIIKMCFVYDTVHDGRESRRYYDNLTHNLISVWARLVQFFEHFRQFSLERCVFEVSYK